MQDSDESPQTQGQAGQAQDQEYEHFVYGTDFTLY